MKALITGITGQDGTYLAELLLSKGYDVVGVVRPGKSIKPCGFVPASAKLVQCDLSSSEAVTSLIASEQPDEIYSLAAVSDYAVYTEDPAGSHAINGLAPVLLMEAIRVYAPHAKLFQAGTCQAFGTPAQSPQDELTPFHPPNPYAISKTFAHFMARYYRQQHGLFIVNGILYNHESPRRIPAFVTRKITQGAALIKRGKADSITLGNLDATRDWGFAGDFVEAYRLTLQQKASDDYIIGTGERHTVREFLSEAFACAGIAEWKNFVKQDERFMRGSDADLMQANPAKIIGIGWRPKIGFKELVKMMVEHDLKQ